MHSDPEAEDTAWTAGLAALAGDRPVVVIDDDTPRPPAPAGPEEVVAVTASLGVLGVEERSGLLDAVGGAAVVLLCGAPGGAGGVRAQPPETLPEWVGLLAERGLYRAADADLAWLPSWGVALERAALGPADLARRYERQLLPIAGHRPPVDPGAARLLSLTDRIIGLEATLAEANYRRDMALLDRQEAILAQQDLTGRLAAAETLVEAMRASASWRVGQRLVGPLRRAGAALAVPRRRNAP